MSTLPPTPTQARILEVIRDLSRGGAPPSYREVMHAAGLNNIGAFHSLLTRMRDRGLVEFEPRRARSLRVVGEIAGLDQWSTPRLRILFKQVRAILATRFDA